MRIVQKGWGHEEILVDRPEYCLKKLVFTKKGNHFSMHFHKEKIETWVVESGSFNVTVINTRNAEQETFTILKGDKWHNDPLMPHKLIALEDNSVILEVSTADSVEDNYRVAPGMSQG